MGQLGEMIESMEEAAAGAASSGSGVPGRRLCQHIILRKAKAEWVSNEAFIRNLSGQGPWLASLSPTQRSVLGFPAVGHRFWQQPTALRQAVGRYPVLDPEPYIDAGATPLSPFSYDSPLTVTGEASTTEHGLFPPLTDRMVFPEPVKGTFMHHF